MAALQADDSGCLSADVDERRETFAERDHIGRISDRQELPVAPHVPASAGEVRGLDRLAHAVQVVAGEEHLAARGADGLQPVGIVVQPASRALEMAEIASPLRHATTLTRYA